MQTASVEKSVTLMADQTCVQLQDGHSDLSEMVCQTPKLLGPEDLSVLAVLRTAAAQPEDLLDCLASISKLIRAKTEKLQEICKEAGSAFKAQEGLRRQKCRYIPA